MAYPDIHTCMKLSAENENLRNKLFRVKQQRDDAQKELSDLKEQHRVQDLLRNYVTTRDVYVQTEPRLGYRMIAAQPVKKKDEDLDTEDINKSNKFLSMHSQLMKRYEKEVKQNLTHIETITALNLQIGDLERKLRERTDEIVAIEKELRLLQIQSRSRARRGQKGRSNSPGQSSGDERDEILKVRKENKKLKQELEKMKLELKGLDHNFFEEVEDVKYALKQSAKLNKLYEKTLRKTCMQFGVPYPHPEKALER